MYYFYLDKILLPIAPSSVDIKISNQNETLNLINGDEINVLKQAGLSSISFDCLLPNQQYPFAIYYDGYQNASYYLEQFENLKTSCLPFQFLINRTKPNGLSLFSTNIKVSLESYTICESSENGFDVLVKVELKQYKDYGTKICTISTDSNSEESNTSISVEEVRETTTAPTPITTQTYTVKSGDSLWAIAKNYYGSGSKYTEIFSANSDKISNANLIYPGQVLVIPSL